MGCKRKYSRPCCLKNNNKKIGQRFMKRDCALQGSKDATIIVVEKEAKATRIRGENPCK